MKILTHRRKLLCTLYNQCYKTGNLASLLGMQNPHFGTEAQHGTVKKSSQKQNEEHIQQESQRLLGLRVTKQRRFSQSQVADAN